MDYWEGYNEPSVSTVSDIQWYAQFEQARMELMAARGLKAVIGCFSVGTPDVTNPDVSVMSFFLSIHITYVEMRLSKWITYVTISLHTLMHRLYHW